jgi:hypothetical protein
VGRCAYERIAREKSASGRSCKQKVNRIPAGSVPGMDGLFVSGCCADFINISSLFCCGIAGLLLPAVPFLHRTVPGRGKTASEKKEARNRGLDCEFTSFGMFGVFDGGQCAYKQIVTGS